MAETISKTPGFKFLKKTNKMFGFDAPLESLISDTADFARSDRDRIKKQEAEFAREQKQIQAESFKPKSAKAVQSRRAATAKSNQSESLLTRTL